jgi:hypothetical protein
MEPKWYSKLRQIKPLITTKQEVEKLFNYPKVTDAYEGIWSNSVDYKLKEGELSISYSQGRCSETNKDNGYDVAKDVVIDVDLYLKKEVSISALSLDLSNFEKTEISDLPNLFTYRNEDLGEYYNGSLEKIRDIHFFPSKEQEKLACKSLKQ